MIKLVILLTDPSMKLQNMFINAFRIFQLVIAYVTFLAKDALVLEPHECGKVFGVIPVKPYLRKKMKVNFVVISSLK